MRRQAFGAVIAAALISPACLGETYLEKVTAVDVDKRTITVPVDKRDRTFPVDEHVDVQQQIRVGKRLRVTPLKDGLKGIKAGTEVTVTTEKKGGQEVVTKIVVVVAERKPGK